MEKREALSPPYTKPIEGKVFSQGPKGVPPLFQSLPNININSVRSQMHFPSSMVSVLIYFFKKIKVGMQLIFTCSKSKIETPEKDVKYVQY